MHVPTELSQGIADTSYENEDENIFDKGRTISAQTYDPKELDAIFERTYGPIDRNKNIHYNREYERQEAERERLRRLEEKSLDQAALKYKSRHDNQTSKKERYLLVDGYNIIFAWEELKKLSDTSLDAARTKLMDIMCNYQGYKDYVVIIVFDAYKVQGNKGAVQKYNNIHVIYTKEAETADQYIEKTVHEIGKKHDVTVATSDALEQMIIWGEGAKRLSARDLQEEMRRVETDMREKYLSDRENGLSFRLF